MRCAVAGEMANMLDDCVRPNALRGDFFQSFPQPGRFSAAGLQLGQTGFGVQGHRGNWLVYFMHQTGGHFAQGVEAGGMSQQRLLPLGVGDHSLLLQRPAHPLRHKLDQLAIHRSEWGRARFGRAEVQRSINLPAHPHRRAEIGFQPEFAIAGMSAPLVGGSLLKTQRRLSAQGIATVGVAQRKSIALSDFAIGGQSLHNLITLALHLRQDADAQAESLAAHRQHGLNLLVGVAARNGDGGVQGAHGADAVNQRRLLFGQLLMALLYLLLGGDAGAGQFALFVR